MIDHDYQIITREVKTTASRDKHFIAKLSQIYLVINGNRIKVSHPQTEFEGKTQVAAMLKASDALRHWLKKREVCHESV